MQVKFYTFSKKENSTYRPSGNGATFGCTLKSTSSIASPIIQLDIGTTTSPAAYNYCYIPEFDRYYYISEWTWIENRLWEASLITDVLATFRNEIGSSTLYILRSSAAYDGNIIDTYYPEKVTCTTYIETGNSPWIHDNTENIDLSTGTFIIGYVTQNLPNNNAMYGSVVYSAMNQANLSALVAYLLDDNIIDPQNGFNLTDASKALQKSLVDPMSFIKSAIWIPVLYDSIGGTTQNTMNIWSLSPTITHKLLTNDPPYVQYLVSGLPISKHPQTATRGNYMNVSPYTRLNLDFPPFGNIELDTTLTANASEIEGRILLDMATGSASLRLLIDNIETSYLTAQVGVPIQLSQVLKDYLGAAVNAGNAVAGIFGNTMGGNLAGAISSGLTGIGNAAYSLLPRSSSTGTGGSFIGLARQPRLYHQFMILVDEDLDHAGRPLCQLRRISELPGFIMVKDGDVDMNGFEGEAEAVRQYLESGFYYG